MKQIVPIINQGRISKFRMMEIMENKNILVTGNLGFIGSYLCERLIALGYNIIGLDIRENTDSNIDYRCITGDILDKQKVLDGMQSADMVINLAAKHHDFGISEREYFEMNEEGTRNLLECAGELGVKSFIFYSTVAVYGGNISGADETAEIAPETPYGKSKWEAERAVAEWVRGDASRQALILRPTAVFGIGSHGNVHNLIKSINERRFLFIGKGGNIKSIAYVENLVEATVYLMERMKPGMEVYNYVDEPRMTVREMVDIISRYIGVPIPRVKLPLSIAVPISSIFDLLAKVTGYNFPITAQRIRKFCTETYFRAGKIREAGFVPPVTLEEGFRRTIEWYKNN